MTMVRYSEPYQPTGGLAAEGVINQLGRPDIEPLEVLVREAVQNCWDARRETEPSIRVEIGRRELNGDEVALVASRVLVDPPPDVPLAEELRAGMRILHFADFGTAGLGGPTRADRMVDGGVRDFVDFVRNIGQPPDKDFGGGSFGYGKAAFYIASRARTIVIDTICETSTGLERRLIGAALGTNHTQDGRSYTGRHWWGTIADGVPEPLTGEDAAAMAALLGLPPREGREGLGTTVAIIAPGLEPDGRDDSVMPFIADALVWNFWPKMISTRGGVQATIAFRLSDDGAPVRLPDPRVHPRLRGFVEAMDRLRTEPDGADPTVIDQPISSQRPIQHLGRLVIQKGPVAPAAPLDGESAPEGMRVTAAGLHHVALMRNAELVVKYLPGVEPTTGRYGYSGVTRLGGAGERVDLGDLSGLLRTPIAVSVPGPEAGGRVDLTTRIVLRSAGTAPSLISPRRSGAVLWTDTQRVALEGNAARFPMAAVDFATLSRVPDGAAWYVDWDHEDLEAPVLGGLRLLLNSAHPRMASIARTASDDPAAPLVRSLIECDVARHLAQAALGNERFVLTHDAFPEESVGRMLSDLLATIWPGIPIASLRARLLEEPARLDAELQEALEIAT